VPICGGGGVWEIMRSIEVHQVICIIVVAAWHVAVVISDFMLVSPSLHLLPRHAVVESVAVDSAEMKGTGTGAQVLGGGHGGRCSAGASGGGLL
jgi:hypothetical protein